MDTDTPPPYRPSTIFDFPTINFWDGFPAQISTDVYKNHENKRQERVERALIEAAQVERERVERVAQVERERVERALMEAAHFKRVAQVERERVERERVERERFDAILSQKGKNPEAKPFIPIKPTKPIEPAITRVLKHFNF